MPAIAVKQLAHVCVFTADVEASARFYRQVLGLPIQFRFTREGAFFGFYLDAGGRTSIEVFAKPAARFAETDRINHICLEVASIDDAVAHIRAQGVEVTDKKLGVDETWQAWTADPDGVKIELFEYTPQSHQFTGADAEANW